MWLLLRVEPGSETQARSSTSSFVVNSTNREGRDGEGCGVNRIIRLYTRRISETVLMSGASSSRIVVGEPEEYEPLKVEPDAGSRRAACCRAFRSSLVLLFAALLVGGIAFLLWPSTPLVEVKEIHLDGINISKDDESSSIIPSFSLDVSLELVVQIINNNVYGLTYDNLLVHIFYRGDEIAQVESDGGSVPAQSVANATAILELQGKEILDNVGDLWADVSNRSVPFVTVTQLTGNLDILFFHPHIQVNSTCELVVDPEEKVILEQECDLDF